MKTKCPVIEDLLPLYIDGVCSDESRMIVEEHLKECESCRKKYGVQNSEIITEDAIKENLKSREPFKKIKKSLIIRVIAVFLIAPLIYLSIVELGGDGVGFSALYGRYKAEKFLSNVEKGKFEDASRYMGFSGGIYEGVKIEAEAKKMWSDGMWNLKSQGIEIISHRQNGIVTDDAFTSGDVEVSVRYNDKIYDFKLFILTNTGKVETGSLFYEISHGSKEPTEVERMLMEKISEVISTYNPG